MLQPQLIQQVSSFFLTLCLTNMMPVIWFNRAHGESASDHEDMKLL